MVRRLNEARQAFEESRQVREDVVVEAWKKGGSLREIAEASGMTHQGVSKMLERLGIRDRLPSGRPPTEEEKRRFWRD